VGDILEAGHDLVYIMYIVELFHGRSCNIGRCTGIWYLWNSN